MGENNIILEEEKIPVSHCFDSNFSKWPEKKEKIKNKVQIDENNF
jgi:hypothetical protein